MKRPISVIIVTHEPGSSREVHNRFDAVTSHPRWKLLSIFFRAFFTIR